MRKTNLLLLAITVCCNSNLTKPQNTTFKKKSKTNNQCKMSKCLKHKIKVLDYDLVFN